MKILYAILILIISAVFTYPVMGQKIKDEVLQTQVRRFEAVIQNDQEELNQLLANDLIYTHSNANTETKEEFLASLKSQKIVYKSIQPEDVRVRLYGKVGIITGNATVGLSQEGKETTLQLKFMDVYAKRKGRWQQISWQSTRLPQ
jgi:hypothetical protein